MTKRNAKLNLTSKVARATVFALLFVLVLGITLSAILYSDVNNLSGTVSEALSSDASADTTYIAYSDLSMSGTTGSIALTGAQLAQYWTNVSIQSSTGEAFSYNADNKNVGWLSSGFKGKGDDSNIAQTTLVMNGFTATGYKLTWSTYSYFKSANNGSDKQYMYLSVKDNQNGGSYSYTGLSSSDLSTSSGSTGNWAGYDSTYGYFYYRSGKEQETPIYCTRSATRTLTLNNRSTIGIQFATHWYNNRNYSRYMYNAQAEMLSLSIEFYGVEEYHFSGGKGTSTSPYILANRNDFDELSDEIRTNNAKFADKVYEVKPDTSNSQTAYSAGGTEIKMLGTEFTPIGGISGSTTYQFKGSIKGNGCTISGLKIPDQKYSGLFGSLGDGASIDKLTVEGEFSGSKFNSHAILAGHVSGTVTITDCTTKGTVTAGLQAAGLVGFADKATLTISGCKNEASVTVTSVDKSNASRSCAGGLIGYTNADCKTTIKASDTRGSSNSGAITGQRGIGGLVGFSLADLTVSGTNSGTISGGIDVGGIVGYMAEGSVSSATNTGSVTGSADITYTIANYDAHPYSDQVVANVNDGNTGTKYYSEKKASMGFIAYIQGGAVINGFAITNANDTADQIDRKPKTVFIFGSNTNDYASDYTEGGGKEYETLVANSNWTQLYYSTDIGIAATNYLRTNIYFDNSENYKYYYIYVSSGSHGANGSKKVQFSEFDLIGNSNIGGVVGRADATSDARVVVSGNTNTNSVTGGNNVGGIIGYSKYGNITVSATNSGAVSGYTCVGGIFGKNYSASATGINVTADSDNEIKNSGKITSLGGDYIGGIGGFTQDAVFSGTIVNAGEISASGKQYVGGIAGYLFGSSLSSGSFNNQAKVVGGEFTGGIAGRSNYGSLGESYNSGRVEGGKYTGGIIGQVTSVTTVVGSVSMRNTAVVKGGNYVGGIFGEWTLKYDKDSETLTIGTFESYGTTAGGSYVGGIVGNLNTSGENLTGIFKVGTTYDKTNYTSNSSGEIVAHTGAFGGGIFGYTSGGATITFKDGTLVVGELDAYEGNIAGSTRNTGVVLGGAVGANIGVTLDFSGCSTTPITSNIIGGTAQDVTINGTEYKSIGMLGGVVGFNSGTLKGKESTNIISTGSIFNVVNGGYVGGIVGYNTGTITNCRSGVTTIGGNDYRANYTGGVIGYNASGDVSGIYANSNIYGYSQIGGYIGASAVVFEFSGLTYSAQINAWGSYVGAFVGYATGKTTFKNCTNSGTIVGTGNRVGGFIGEGTEVVFSGSNVNSGNVTGGSYNTNTKARSNGSYTGGFVGNATTAIDIESSANLRAVGRVIGFADYVGGLFGYWKAKYTKTDIGTLEFYGTVAGVNYVGGIAGYFDTDSKNIGAKFIVGTNDSYTVVGEVVAPIGNYGGGFFGYATGGTTITFNDGTSFSGQLDACNNDKTLGLGFTSTGSAIGCAVGYNNNVTLDFSACTTTPIAANIIGRQSTEIVSGLAGSYMGGVVGYNGGTIKGSSSVDLVTISSEFYAANGSTSGVVGGVAGYNAGTITNARVGGTSAIGGNDNFLRGSHTGGIVGYNVGTVSGVYVNKTIYGVGYVGGYFGYTTSGVSNIYHTATINGSGQYVGGIAGYAVGATFKSCYHKGTITGGTNVGGIVGGGTPSLQYCYVEVDDSNLLTGTTVGGLSGETGGSYSYAWAFYYGSNAYGKCTVDFGRALRIEDDFKSTAHVYPQTSDTNWDIVTTTAVAWFRITGLSVSNGNYLGLIKMTNAVTPATSNLEYVKPNSVKSTANSDGSVAFDYVQYMGYEESSIQVSNRTINDATAIMGGANGTNNFTYNGENKVNKTNYQLLTGVKYNKATFTHTSDDAVNVTSAGYKYKIVVCYDSTGAESTADNTVATPILGQKLNVQGQAITAFDLSAADAIYCYDGPAYGMPAAPNGNKGYDISAFKTAGVGVLEYTGDYTTKFYVYSTYFGKVIYDASNNANYTTVTMNPPTVSLTGGVLTNRIQENNSISFNGASNYKNSKVLYYTLIDSDFGVKSGKTRDNTWGSESNPFVISNWIYLQRLSDIVNGTMQPIDSVTGKSKLTSASTKATTIFYDGCYFEVTEGITIPDGIIFNPIGGYAIGNATSYNVGVESVTSPTSTKVSYFGGNIASDSSTIRNIEIGNHLNYAGGTNRDYMGLFGYVRGTSSSSKAGVKNLAVLGNVNSGGGDYVGGVVGYAENAVIDSCYVNASSTSTFSVGGNNYVGSIVGYLGKGSELYSTALANGTIYNQYVTVAGAHYVGGFIGAIEQGAGYDAGGNTYVVGNNGDKVLKLVNNGTIEADSANSEYVGGIVGAIISENSTNISKFAPEIARNLSSISGKSYIGGIVGAVLGSNVISLENAETSDKETWSYNGTYDGDTVITIGGTGYIGGIAGYLDAGNNLFTRVFSTAKVSGGSGGSYVGGLVGLVKGGSFVSCFVSEPGTTNVLATTEKVKGGSYVGGLAGSADGANVSFTDCYVQGFKWSSVSSSSGGVAGYASSTVKFENSWALYLAVNADYTTVSKNANGKYIIADPERTDNNTSVRTANIYEMAIFAGLLSSTSTYNGGKANTTKLGKGIIPLGITLPSPGTLSDATTKAQIVFYDVSGTETATDNKFDAENDNASDAKMIYIYLGVGAESMSACRRQVVFNNVSDYTSKTAWENAYLSLTKPIQNREKQYTASVTLTNTAGPYEGTFKISFIANYTVSGSTVTGTAVFVSRNVSFNYANNSVVAPLIIDSMDDWTAFANAVRGTDGTYTGYVKLTNNIGTTSNPVTLPAGYNSTTDVNKYRFGGTFDGNGYTITVKLWASASDSNNEMGLFPQAAGATFKNLTIAGSVGVVTSDSNGNPTADATASGEDIGAFVGIARGDLTFLNCKNQAYVSGGMGHNTGGLVGTANNNNVTFVDCVNEGGVISAGNFSSNGTVKYGVGGIIGSTGTSTTGSVILESCRNTAVVMSDANVGGIIGLSASTCTIRNSGNTGNITGASAYESDTCVGGIAGIGTEAGKLNIYACYNNGDILAYGNKAGGILGGDSQYTEVGSNQTMIYYCYNTGSVTTGGPTAHDSGGGGVQAAGIVATLTNIDIQYCYNVGTITANGLVYTGTYAGVKVFPHARVGGIGGYAGDDAKIVLKNCYNVGLIVIGSNIRTASGEYNDASYAAGILGEIEDNFYNSNVSISNNYSLKWQVHRLYKTNSKTLTTDDGGLKSGWDSYEWQSYCNYYENCSYSGTIMPSFADLTAAYFDGDKERIVPLTANRTYNTYTANDENNSTVVFGATGSAAVMNTTGTKEYSGATTVTATGVNTGIEDGSLGGYIYVYGCLPQLACFALDTENGLAMTSMGYGYDEVNEQYVLQPAGGEYNPYIIKDGIDLMSLTAITQPNGSHYDFDGEYIEFADSTNNLAGDICTYINLPTDENNLASAYKFANNGGTLTEGKSYHIYKYGAVIQQKKNYYETGTNSYTQWKARNAYCNGTSLTTGAGISTVNYYPVGMFGNSENRTFKGTINGSLKTINANNIHQTDWDGTSKAEVRGLKLDRTIGHSADIYAGLFAFVDGATLANIKVSGTITGRAISSGKNVHAGVVGYAMGESVLDGLETTSLTIQAINNTGSARTNAVGGIIGVAEPAKEETITIKNCIVGGNTKIIGFGPNIGGIIGLSSSRKNGDVEPDASAQVVVENCNVKSAIVNSDKAVETLVGGIVGKCDDVGSLTVTGSSVGTIGTTTTGGQNVKIYGSYAIGGIAGNAVANVNSNMAFIDCTVYGDVLIERTNTTNDGTYGTAIGGIVGYISNDDKAFSLFRGSLGFHGTIDATVTATVNNIGGAVGYMGTSAVFDSIDVHIYGAINTPDSGTVENIGGFAGYGAGGTLDGTFFVAPTLSCAQANYVGGFIGLNAGNTAITRSSKVYTAKENGTTGEPVTNGGGSITGNYYIGGFIGGNSATGDNGLYIGAKEFLGASYGSDGDFAVIGLYSSVDGKAYIGGFLGRNEGNLYGEYCQVNNYGQVGASSTGTSSKYVEIIGGIIGSNGASAKISFGSDATFQNDGQVGNSAYATAYQKFVGGILGANAGAFANSGTLVNTGSVYGEEYVGGAIGLLISGTISGQLANGVGKSGTAFAADSDALACDDSTTGNASVTAVQNVGGVIGAMLGASSIVATTADTKLYNYGEVTATAAISNAGGIIGLMYGKIEGTSAHKVEFANYGKVTANSFAGGIIGVVDGLVSYASFTNYSSSMEFKGDTAMGGAIGLITTGYGNTYYPSSTVSSVGAKYSGDGATNQYTHITNTHFAYQASVGSTEKVTVTATGTTSNHTVNSITYAGGLGGVIGVIDASDINDKKYWNGNSYYVNGDVIGANVDGVGGLVGIIKGAKVIIDNMLVYLSKVQGRYNVGGIVGYNGSSVTDEASIVNCFNVKGEVVGSLKDNNSTYGGIVGYAGTGTYTDGSYWILPFLNDVLNKVDPDNISGTLSASFNVAGSGNKGYGEWLTAKTTTETKTTENTDGEVTKIVTTTTVKGGELFIDAKGAKIEGKVAMTTTLYYDTVATTTTSTLDEKKDEWTTVSNITHTYTAIGTPKNILNFSLAYMSAHPDEPSALGYASWAELAKAYDSNLIYNSALGYGKYGAAGNIVYTTGDIEHGFFYVYAENTADEVGATISVDIKDKELAQWNIIANTPVKGTIANSTMTYNNGAIQVGHIYTTAGVPNGTGYYVYFYGTTPNPNDSNAESDYSALSVRGKTSSGTTGTIYFDWDTTQYEVGKDKDGNDTRYGAVGNVLVYYKKTVMESGLVYNGQQRYAPITGMTYQAETAGDPTKNQSYYYFDAAATTDGSVNTATDAGTYDVKANIWFRDTAKNIITIGSVDSTVKTEYQWTINKRDLELTDKTKTTVGIYDSTYKHYVEFIVANSVYGGDELLNLLGLTAENAKVTAVSKSMPDEGTNSTTAYYSVADGTVSKDVNDTSYTVKDDGTYGSVDNVQTYTYTVRVFFNDAGSHKVVVKTNSENIGKNYSLEETTLTVQVNRRKLTVTATWTDGASGTHTFKYNGGASYQGVTKIEIGGSGNEGFVGNDAQSVKFTITATATANGSTNNNLITVGAMTTQGKSSVHYDIQATDAATYTVTVTAPSSATGAAKNYTVSGAGEFKWTIDKFKITKSGMTLKTTTVTYDGKAHYIDTSAGDGTSSENKVDLGKEHVTFRVNVTYSGDGVSNNVAVNAGTYTATLSAEGGGSGTGTVERDGDCLSKLAESKAIENYDIEFTGMTSGTATLTIEKAKINLTSWNVGSYVYLLNKEQGPSVTGATVGGATIPSGNIEYKNGKLTISNIFDNNETVVLTASNFRGEDAGDYTAKVTKISSVSGTNATGKTTVVGNYELGTGLEKAYSIAKSKIAFTYTGTVGDKVYDGKSTYSGFGSSSYSISSTNDGDTSKSAVSLSSAVYMNGSTAVSDTNAKTGVNAYTVRFIASLTDTKNYEWASGNTYTTSATAHITPKGLTVTLNDSSGRAYKSFDNNYEYASVESSGATSAKSKSQRTGKGITVSGFVANQAKVTVTVNFREEDRTSRAGFDEYVNGIYKDGEVYKSGGAFNKMLEVALSSTDNSSYLNYYIAGVNRKGGSSTVTIGDTYKDTTIYVLSKNTQITASTINSVRAYKSNDLTIEITKYTAKANYSNTTQSYANADNTYNTDWIAVSGSLRVPSSWNLDVEVEVKNGWMKNSDGTAKEYTKYTRIVGSTTKADLGATLNSSTGKDLCITLRNQPTLIIGYFVVKDGSYQVGSVAGLLIATEYYKGNFKDEASAETEKAYNFVVVPMAVPTGVELDVTTYPTNWEDFLEAYYTKFGESYDIATHPQYKEDYEALLKNADYEDLELTVEYGDYFDENGNAQHGYYYWQPIEVEMPTYTDFVQVNDFDMIVTDLDLQIITEAFGANWGSGNTYLSNVILFKVGSVAILSDSVFTGDFNGSYDGAGYTINHLTILANVTSGDTANIGLFAHLGTTGGVENVSTVKSVNLRNANIQVYDSRTSGTLSVGGIIGYNQASKVLSDCTFHGTITVYSGATVNVGGLVGKDEASVDAFTVGETTVTGTPIYGGTVIATITVTAPTVNVGGIVGLAYTGNVYYGVVSVSEIYVYSAGTINAGGILGAVNTGSATVTDGYYLGSAIYGVNDGTYTAKSNSYGTANSYDALYKGSNSNYNTTSGVMGETATDKGKYDFVADVQPQASASETATVSPRESMRLRDIIDTHVLGYKLSTTDVTVDTNKTATAYKKATSSEYVGTANGTSDNRIGIAHQQHLSLLYAFNYMHFSLNNNIVMYTGYELKTSPEAFIGSVNANGHNVNVRTRTATGSIPTPFKTSSSENFSWITADSTTQG